MNGMILRSCCGAKENQNAKISEVSDDYKSNRI